MPKPLDAHGELLFEDLERLHLKLRVESSITTDAELAKRLNDLAAEAEDSMLRVKEWGLGGEFQAV